MHRLALANRLLFLQNPIQMFKPQIFFFFLSLWVMLSCSSKNIDREDILGFRTDSLSLPIDYTIFPSTFSMQYVDGNLYWMSRDKSTIHQLDFKNKKFDLVLKFQEEGPDGVGNPLGFYMHNLDSIYLPSRHRLFLVNRKAKVLNVYDFSDFELIGPLSSQSRYSGQYSDLSNGVAISLNPDLLSKSLLNKDFLKRYFPFLVFNPRTESIERLDFNFDPSVFDEGPNIIGSSYSGSGNDLFVMTRYSGVLHKFDCKTEKTSAYALESSLVNNFTDRYFKSDPRNHSLDDNTRLMYKYSSNIGLLFDPYRQLVYRMGWKGDELDKKLNFMKFSEFLPHFVVGVYDAESLQLLGEFDLPRNKYLAHHYFVSKDGLNLFLNHPDDPNSKEDEITIEVFDFSDLRR